MPFTIYAMRLFALAETLHRWVGVLTGLDRANRERIADYAEAIAATLSRAGTALATLDRSPADIASRREAIRELGRITGYLETMVGVLQHHLDGRKIAGIKRRLETLGASHLAGEIGNDGREARLWRRRSAKLFAAEGYFRALADGLRA